MGFSCVGDGVGLLVEFSEVAGVAVGVGVVAVVVGVADVVVGVELPNTGVS